MRIEEHLIFEVKIASEIQKTRIGISNRMYSMMAETYVRNHPLYEKLLMLRKDKTKDRKETAKFTKQLLAQQLEKESMTMDDFKKMLTTNKKDDMIYTGLRNLERAAFKSLEPALETVPVYKFWLRHIRGMGPLLALQLCSKVRDIERFPNPSKLKKYFGLAPNMKLHRGQQADFNPEAKGLMLGKIASCFIKLRGQYKKMYDETKQFYHETHPDWTKGHCHNYARKAMMNRFAVEMWIAWHISEDRMPPVNPYITLDPKHALHELTVPVQNATYLKWVETIKTRVPASL